MFGSLFNLIQSLFDLKDEIKWAHHVFKKYLPVVCCVPSTILSTENNTVVHKRKIVLALMELTS